MKNTTVKEIEAKKKSISPSLDLDPDELRVRVSAHSFAQEFWDEVIDATEGDADALMGVYATLAVLIEREKLFRLTFNYLYAFHLWMGAETTLPVELLENKPMLTLDPFHVDLLNGMLDEWQEQLSRMERNEITQEEYDFWRYNYS